jgi:hypothetical protein
MSEKKLLIEYLPFNVDKTRINESIKHNGGKLIVSGILQRANVRNQNSRVYPKALLEKEVSRYVESEVSQNGGAGELDHPESSTVNLKNVSHRVIAMEWRGDDLYGTIEILPTPSGNILKTLFESNLRVGISSRGIGSVKPMNESDDAVEVQPDFNLIAFDFVSTPSTQGAWMKPVAGQPVVKESLEYGGLNNISRGDKIQSLVHDIICEMSGICCLNK